MTAGGRPSPRRTPASSAQCGSLTLPDSPPWGPRPSGRCGRALVLLGPKDARDLLAVKGLTLEERTGQGVELVDIVFEDLAGSSRAVDDDLLDLAVDHDGRVLAVVLLARHFPAEEDVLLVLAEGERTQLVGHPPLADHLAGHLGGLLEVVAGARGL